MLTASHKMLYIIISVYVAVAALGIMAAGYCLCSDTLYEYASQVLTGLFSYTAVCGSSTIIVYTNKAAKENELKISGDKYRMRLELAKEIYKSIGDKKLDDKSVALLKMLASESENNITEEGEG